MLIYEVIAKGDSHYVLFRTKDRAKADAFCAVYNQYHVGIFDESTFVKVIDTSKIDAAADKFIADFKFMYEVTVIDGKVDSIKPVFVNDSRVKANEAVNTLSNCTKLYFDITDDLTDELIFSRYEAQNG